MDNPESREHYVQDTKRIKERQTNKNKTKNIKKEQHRPHKKQRGDPGVLEG